MQKKKNIIIVLVVVFSLFIAIGYAAFRTLLTVNGTVGTSGTWNIHFVNITDGVIVGSASNNTGSPSFTNTTAFMDANLKYPGDSITYELTLKNDGTIGGIVEEIEAVAEGSHAIVYSITGIQKGDKLASGESKIITIKIEYDSNITSQPALTNKTLTVAINCVQDTEEVPSEELQIVDKNIVTTILQDNIIQSDEDIDFKSISSDTNGNGLYYTLDNTQDGNITYYFRGAVENNYVSFAGILWKIVRINEDGSVKLIHSTSIGNSIVNYNTGDNSFVGYMYGTLTTYTSGTSFVISGEGEYYSRMSTSATMKVASEYTFDSTTGVYTLVDPVDGTYTDDYLNYYTCHSATENTCVRLVKIIKTQTNGNYYEILDAEIYTGNYSLSYEQAHSNQVSSIIKNKLDEWYATNLASYSEYIAEGSFCNDRLVSSIKKDPEEILGYGRTGSYYGAYKRLVTDKNPSFICSQENDLFTTSSSDKGNKALTYPIGLLTADEVVYAGNPYNKTNTTSYLFTEDSSSVNYWWTISPSTYMIGQVSNFYVANGRLTAVYVNRAYAVRPVINLKPEVMVTSGNGTKNNPYIIKTS